MLEDDRPIVFDVEVELDLLFCFSLLAQFYSMGIAQRRKSHLFSNVLVLGTQIVQIHENHFEFVKGVVHFPQGAHVSLGKPGS